MSSSARAGRIVGLVLLVLLPLAWTPLTIDLRPQKSLVFALALPLAALVAPSRGALASLALGLGWLGVFPDAPWPILAVFAAPTVHAALSSLVRTDRAFVLRLVPRAVIVVCAVALAGAAGLLPLETSRFHLPYPVLVGTLGNPNHLAALLLLALPVCMQALASAEKPARIEATVAFALAALTTLLCRSHLATLVLAAEVLLFAPRLRLGLPLAALALAPIALSSAGFFRALEGRLYLFAVHARGFSFRNLLLGVGPSEIGPRFLDWQADHLAQHPARARLWTFPEHPHDDLVALPLAFGVVAAAAAFVLLKRHLVFTAALENRPRHAALLAVSLLALGAGLMPSPVTWAFTLLLAAFTLKPREEAPPPAWVRSAHVLVASVWLVVMLAETHTAHVLREATRAAAIDHDPARALRMLEHERVVPFDRAHRLHLEGRVLLEAGRPREASLVLREAAQRLPHPTVWKTLCAAERASGRPEEARSAARAWLRVRPDDPEALAELWR